MIIMKPPMTIPAVKVNSTAPQRAIICKKKNSNLPQVIFVLIVFNLYVTMWMYKFVPRFCTVKLNQLIFRTQNHYNESG